MEATAEKSTLAEQRAQKKAARRAAFIQEVAEAVCNEQALRGRAATMRIDAEQRLSKAERATKKELSQALLEAEAPLEALFKKEVPNLPESNAFVRNQEEWTNYRMGKMLEWAIERGHLAAGTTTWPDREGQFKALAQ